MTELLTTRRELLIAPLLASLPAALLARPAQAAPDPSMTLTKLPQQIAWQHAPGNPENSVENAPLFGKSSEPGLYYNLTRWYPGFMSGPHWYETDRYCVVEWSGTINEGPIPFSEIPDVHTNGVPGRDKSDPSYRRPLTNQRAPRFVMGMH